MSLALVVLLLVLLVSVVVAGSLCWFKQAERPVKIMMFIGYFWLLTFSQLLIVVLLYFVGQRFFPDWIS